MLKFEDYVASKDEELNEALGQRIGQFVGGVARGADNMGRAYNIARHNITDPTTGRLIDPNDQNALDRIKAAKSGINPNDPNWQQSLQAQKIRAQGGVPRRFTQQDIENPDFMNDPQNVKDLYGQMDQEQKRQQLLNQFNSISQNPQMQQLKHSLKLMKNHFQTFPAFNANTSGIAKNVKQMAVNLGLDQRGLQVLFDQI